MQMVVVGKITKASFSFARANIYGVPPGLSLCVYDIVYIGERKIRGEVEEISGDGCRILLYEDGAGICGGDAVYTDFSPLKVTLGPGFFEGVLDPLLQPVRDNTLPPGKVKLRHFDARLKFGDKVTGGSLLGYVRENDSLIHKIKCPPNMDGTVIELRAGYFRPPDRIGKIKRPDGNIEDVRLYTDQNCRIPRANSGRIVGSGRVFTGNLKADGKYCVLRGNRVTVEGVDFISGIPFAENRDIVVYVALGIKKTSVSDYYRQLSDRGVSEKTVFIACPVGSSALMREAAVLCGVSVSEYFRDMGISVILAIDSFNEFADALQSKADFISGKRSARYDNAVIGQVRKILSRAGNYAPPAEENRAAAITLFTSINRFETEKDVRLTNALLEDCDCYFKFSKNRLCEAESFHKESVSAHERRAANED